MSESLPSPEDYKKLIRINLRQRRQISRLIGKLNAMVYNHKYYMKTRGRSIKERQIINTQYQRNISIYRKLRKIMGFAKLSLGTGDYLFRVSRYEALKLKLLLKLDFRKLAILKGRKK